MLALYIVIAVVIILLFASLRTVRPTDRGLVERFGKYARFAQPGLHIILPFGIERLFRVNITEMMVSSEKREIITADSLNAEVDSNVYFKVKPEEENVKKSVYGVYNYREQIVALAKTTLRNIIGTMTLKEANSERNKINLALFDQLAKETGHWGIEIVRTELKEIQPPQAVQEVMNSVVVANNQKIAAQDFATATETKADGERRAAIKMAEGDKQARILRAEGEAQAIALVNEAADKYFIGNAQLLRKLEAVEKSLVNNAKIVLPSGQSLVNVIGDLAGLTTRPTDTKKS
jgi:regulator of protease activity HflC (stomatin/prohibitin superfamily)